MLILYDGQCGLCDRVVQLVLEKDESHQFVFAALQSDYGKQIMLDYDYEQDSDALESFILIEEGKLYDRSSAGLRLGYHLSYPYRFFYPFIFLPTFVRDIAYDLVAKNRHRFFAAPDQCRLPKPQESQRFLDRPA